MASSDFRRERAVDRVLGSVVVGLRPYQIAKNGQGGRRLGCAANPRTEPTCRSASPRVPARVLLVVAGQRLETPARGRCGAGLDIGRCNDDMGGAGSCRDVV